MVSLREKYRIQYCDDGTEPNVWNEDVLPQAFWEFSSVILLINGIEDDLEFGIFELN